LNPINYFSCVDNNGTPPNNVYDMSNQNLEYEFSYDTKFPINSLAKDILTASMVSDLENALRTLEKLELSDSVLLRGRLEQDAINAGQPLTPEQLEQAVRNQLAAEEQIITGIITEKFSHLIGFAEKQATAISKEHTNLGSRASRLDLLSVRLEAENLTLDELRSLNEDIDVADVFTRQAQAQAVYQSSLQVAASIMKVSLVNFI